MRTESVSGSGRRIGLIFPWARKSWAIRTGLVLSRTVKDLTTWAVIGLVMAVNLGLVVQQIQHLLGPSAGADYFETFVSVLTATNPYEVPTYLWSPLAVPLLGLVIPFGWHVWLALHAAALLLIRTWWVTLLVGLSWPFWWDVASSNVIVFVFVAAWTALRGNKLGALAFMVMALLMPRPIMLPVLVWLLWRQPWTRWPFIGLLVVNVALVPLTGLGDEWILRLLATGGHEIAHVQNIGPSHWIGTAWLPIGLVLAAVLTWKGRLGLASLAAAPYIFPYYLMFGFLELRADPREGVVGPVPHPVQRLEGKDGVGLKGDPDTVDGDGVRLSGGAAVPGDAVGRVPAGEVVRAVTPDA